MKNLLFASFFLLLSTPIKAQIGYQVSLLNSATGEPRANEQVICHVELTDKDDATVWSEDLTTTTNEFGVISLAVGNNSMFKDFKWAEKLPLYISVKIDDVLIGKSQILNVPIAEAAKSLVNLAPELLSGTWRSEGVSVTFTFSDNKSGSCTFTDHDKGSYHYKFEIEGNTIWYYSADVRYLRYYNGHIYSDNGIFSR